ncbi:hypothetical protein M4I33_15815 [Clostridium sp. LY3-2]|uniref:phage tail protein n=1 Tax=Clostridium sp. LY3-2 TaxID=2942482 RepID=UPI0021520618|nr:hypothetical protein [Clostridium sp. LY3-2]MCR6516330.1 hypothetical protein [Clostridium sp. LY3-2]
MSEVFVASGSINIKYSQAIDAFKQVDNEAKKTTKTLDNTSKKSKSWSDKFSSFGNKMTLGVSTPLIGAGVASFKFASDLNENINKTDVVFKNNANTVMDWSKTSLDKMGMCQSSALEMASKFGDMGSSMGLNTNQTKDYSMGLTQLAADLASFKNISIDRANDALTGVYTGETESLKGLGIVMTQTNLQQFAESQGIHKKIQDMTQAEQVQLRYNYVMSKTKDAQGDFARTGDQAANAGRTFGEATKELGATIGNNLLPMFTPIINDANNMIKSFTGMDKGTQQLIIKLGMAAIAIGPVAKTIGTLGKSVSSTTKFIKNMPGNVKKATTSISNFGKGVKNGTNFIGKFGKGIVNCVKVMGKFTLSIIKNTAMAVKNGAIWVAQKVKLLAFKTAQLAVTAATKAMTIAQKALNLAMRMNPIGIVITILLALATTFVTLYKKCDWFRNGVNRVWGAIKNTFKSFSNFLTGMFTRDWTKSFGAFGNIINAFMHNIKSVFDSVKRIFGGIIDFVAGVFTGDWGRAWEGVKNIFGGIMDGLGAVIKAPLNCVIGLINMAIDGINSISFTTPDWVPFVGGKHFGANLGHINYLYTGAVFDEPTLLGNTVVGDKFKGQGSQREYVLPEPLIRKVVSETVREEISKLAIIMDGREVARCMAKHRTEMDSYSRNLNPSYGY